MLRKPHHRTMRELAAARQGVAFVEAALIAPFLILVITGIVDLAMYGAALLKAQQAVNRGLEMSMMGGASVASSDIQSQAATQAGVSTSNVVVTQTQECSGTAATWGSSCATGQETAKYTQIQLSTTYHPLLAFGTTAWMQTDANGDIPISVTGVIRIQ